LLNISRQEISTTGEVLSQDGLTTEGTIFVEDGSGVKSGLKLGVSLAEVMDPTTDMGIVNVRYGDRTYAKVRDLRIFTTAIASAQSALSEATSTSISNLETAFQLLEDDINSLEENLQSNISNEREKIQELTINQNELTDTINSLSTSVNTLVSRVESLSKQGGDDLSISGNLTVAGETILTELTVDNQIILKEVKEKVYTLSGSDINPANGSIQTKTLSSSQITFSESLEEGQTVVLMLEGGGSAAVSWPSMTWVSAQGNTPPTLTAKDTLVFWKVGTQAYGAYIGSYA
jgi:predicted RNase H-like nuclease (RuvC/YqgF family)